MKWMTVFAAGCVTLAGCATSPENIAPAYVSPIGYQGYSCRQLGEEQARVSSALATMSDAQRHARSNDTIGVIFLGLPVSSLSGNNVAAEIRRLKGEMEAVQSSIITHDCGRTTALAPAALVLSPPAPATAPAQRCRRGLVVPTDPSQSQCAN